MNPLYRPNETNAEIFSEHTWLQGALLACVAYGMEVILYAMSLHLLWLARRDSNKGRNMALMAYITVMFILGTLYIAGLLEFTQESFIDGRNIPGGPNAYENEMYSIPIDMLGNVTMVMLTWMCDIINVWRCSVIYKGSRVPQYAVLALPILMYLASIVLGILWLKQVGTVSLSPWDTPGVNFTIPYYTMSLALNILVTILICVRLLLYRARINRAMGKNMGSQYTSLAAMIVESAAIYSTFSLLFLIPFALNRTTSLALSQLFLQALSPVQVTSTLLIIFRVAQGKGWQEKTIATISEAGGATHTIGGTRRTGVGSSGIRIQTNTTTYTDSGKESITLQTMDRARRSLEFNELKTRSGPHEDA